MHLILTNSHTNRLAISKYSMHLVVANELHSRYNKVQLVDDSETVEVRNGD